VEFGAVISEIAGIRFISNTQKNLEEYLRKYYILIMETSEKRKEWGHRWYLRNRERVLEKAKNYAKTDRGKEVQKKAGVSRYLRDKKKVLARGIIFDMIRSGRMRRGTCMVCDQPGQAHHDDYDKPKEVTWLCNVHHRVLHRHLKYLEKP